MTLKLLTRSNPKTDKSAKQGYLTAILHLAPFDLSGRNVCPYVTEVSPCVNACLNTSGHGGIPVAKEWSDTTVRVNLNAVQRARIARTNFFWNDRDGFLEQLDREIRTFAKYARKRGYTPTVRLNGTSDLSWESFGVFEWNPGIQFYDYTKGLVRVEKYLAGSMPDNYYLLCSLASTDDKDIRDSLSYLRQGGNVAAVFRDAPDEYLGFPVISGDDSDLRFNDPRGGYWIALTPKGRAKKSDNAFVIGG